MTVEMPPTSFANFWNRTLDPSKLDNKIRIGLASLFVNFVSFVVESGKRRF